MNTIKPMNDRILVKRREALSKTAGGIYLPGGSQDKPNEGDVVAVGPGRLLKDGNRAAPDVSIGDHVTYSPYAGSDVRIDGEDYVILREEDVLGIVVSEKTPQSKSPKKTAKKKKSRAAKS